MGVHKINIRNKDIIMWGRGQIISSKRNNAHTVYICSSTSDRCLTVHFNLRQTLCLLQVTGKTRRIRLFFGPFSRESQFQNLTISRRSDQLPTCKTVQAQNSVPTRKATPRTIHGAASLAWTKQRYATAAANNITLGRRSLAMWRRP